MGCRPPICALLAGVPGDRARAGSRRCRTAARRLAGLVAAALVAAAAPAVSDELAAADAAYARRAEGAREGWVDPAPIRQAVAAYAAALELDPTRLPTRWKLLRALHFEGRHAAPERALKQRIFERARAVAEVGEALLAERLGVSRSLRGMPAERLRERLTAGAVSGHEVAAFYFWAALAWGDWGQTAGTLGAVRHGVARRIRDYALLVLALEPDFREGGAQRMLAALYARVPKIPFLTGWADRSEALRYAEEAVAIAPTLSDNRLLLAVTLLDLRSERRAEALAVLEELAASDPRPGSLVEDLSIRREARERLARERETDG